MGIGEIAVLLGAGVLGAASAEGERVEKDRQDTRKFLMGILSDVTKTGRVEGFQGLEKLYGQFGLKDEFTAGVQIGSHPIFGALRKQQAQQAELRNTTSQQVLKMLQRQGQGTGGGQRSFLPRISATDQVASPNRNVTSGGQSIPAPAAGASTGPSPSSSASRGPQQPLDTSVQGGAASVGSIEASQLPGIDQFVLQGIQKRHPDVSFSVNPKGGASFTIKPGSPVTQERISKTAKSRVLRIGSQLSLSIDQLKDLGIRYGFVFTEGEAKQIGESQFMKVFRAERNKGATKQQAVDTSFKQTNVIHSKFASQIIPPVKKDVDVSVAVRSTLNTVAIQTARGFAGGIGLISLSTLSEPERQRFNSIFISNVEKSLRAQRIPDVDKIIKELKGIDPLALYLRKPKFKEPDATLTVGNNTFTFSEIIDNLESASQASVPVLKAFLAELDRVIGISTKKREAGKSEGRVSKIVGGLKALITGGEETTVDKDDAETLRIRLQFKIQQLGG